MRDRSIIIAACTIALLSLYTWIHTLIEENASIMSTIDYNCNM